MKRVSNQKIHENNLNNLENAAIELLKTKKYREITVTDICNLAGVSRMTFYKNYSCTDDVLASYLQKDFEQIFQSIALILNTGGGPKFFQTMLEEIKKRKELLKIVFSENGSLMFHLFMTNAEKINDPNIHFKKYEMQYFIGSYFAVIRQWVMDDCKDPIDELAQFLFNKT